MADTVHAERGTHVPTIGSAHDRGVSIRLMLIGVLVGLFGPIGGFLGGTIVNADHTIAGLEPLFVWLFLGMTVGGIGVTVGIIGALRWVRGNHHLE
ncbi:MULTISPECIES: hypothetical protein [unclassified Cryobacterium]|uniref:hypothetical protein n=1 Tax=unclassified Cryobacterium TaxID=2649013 RepID=UPI002AB52F05|nr:MULTISPECIES: hypothetical protein [unclassified Cryobacterium]MDY7527409.1 hypothetical protein [Cryobacterium sp. 10C2]MDY7556805.1 hypothetical protein [Cryobacterium sp. 10C3]MEB0003641.1 hypothetical protein [Cryobacterium sp. RTC2.1]MEB0290923.1 hypothetical protein [Cryobacterium sp. 10C2]